MIIQKNTLITQNYYKKDIDYLLETILGKKRLLCKLIFHKILDSNRLALQDNNNSPSKLWKTSYKSLQKSLEFSREAIRLNILILEKFNLLKRKINSTCIVTKNGHPLYKNSLYLILRMDIIDSFLALNSSSLPSKKWGINKNNKINNIDLERANFTKLKEKEDKFPNIVTTKPKISLQKLELSSQQIYQHTNKETNQIPKDNNSKKVFTTYTLSKSLEQCLPITEEEGQYLRKVSNKDYSTVFINELVKHLNIKKPTFRCLFRKGFLNYIITALRHEKRIIEQVNAGSYKFPHMKEQNDIFNKIENSSKITIDAQVKKRIANKFTPEIALSLIKNCSFPDKVLESNNSSNRIYGIYYQDSRILSMDEKIKLTEIVTDCSSYTDIQTGEIKSAKVLFICSRQQKNLKNDQSNDSNNVYNHNSEKLLGENSSSSNNKLSAITDIPSITQNIDADGLVIVDYNVPLLWREIRKQLLKKYKVAVDKSWFSKINFSYDENAQIVMLQYSSIFAQRIVNQQYGSDIYAAIRSKLPNIKTIKSSIENGKYMEDVWWQGLTIYDNATTSAII